MNIIYKSSFFQTVVIYIVPLLFVVIFWIEALFLISDRATLSEFPIYSIPIFIWAFVWCTVASIKFRYIEIIDDNILLKTINGNKVLEYNDIEWINQSSVGTNWPYLSIKYKDKRTGKYKVIITALEIYTKKENTYSLLNPFSELNATKFIREKIINFKPEYLKENEPSRWYFVKNIFLSLVPFLLITIYLLIK